MKEKYKFDSCRMGDYSNDDWMTVAECITAYMNTEKYPTLDVVLAMIGIREETDGSTEANH